MNNKSVAFLWGAGAVENSWLPILKSLHPLYLKRDLLIEEANMLLALLVYNLRFHAEPKEYPDDKVYVQCKEMLQNHRQNICDQIKHYQNSGQLKVQEEFDEILNKVVLKDCHRLLLITTNWDTAVEDAIKTNASMKKFMHHTFVCTHLHGIYHNPNMLYLPTEIVNEKYRSHEQEIYIGLQHSSAMTSLLEAQVLVIYGLSISPLDAELIQILSTSLSLNTVLETVKIVDINPNAVAKKIKIILNGRNFIRVEEYYPHKLDSPEIYF